MYIIIFLMSTKFLKKKKSFTLIELLVVIVIIGILAGVIMISTSSSINKANITKSKVFEGSVENNLAANMVSRWKLDGNVNDSWGLSNGTNNGVTFPNESLCVSGQCGSFNGTSYVDCGNDSNLNIRGNLTIGSWIKISGSIADSYRVVSKFHNEDSSYDGYSVSFTLSAVYFQIFKNNVGSDGTISYNMPLNTFLYMTNVYDGVNLKLYINGVYINSIAAAVSSIGTTSTNLQIGRYISGIEYFTGIMDDIRIYDAALPTSQIKQNYIAGLDSLLSKSLISKDEYGQRLSELALK